MNLYDRIKKLEDELDELKNILNEDIDDKYSESETIDLSEPSKRFLTFEDIQSIDDKYLKFPKNEFDAEDFKVMIKKFKEF